MYRGALPLTWQLREINHLPGITFFWQICSHRPGSRANGLQSISVKDMPSINYSVTCASVLQYLQCCTKLLSQRCTVPEAAFAWAIIPSALPLPRGGERQGAFITDQKTSLEVPGCKHDWGLMRGLHCAYVINEAGGVSSLHVIVVGGGNWAVAANTSMCFCICLSLWMWRHAKCTLLIMCA